MKIMYELLLVLIVILFAVVQAREHFSLPGWMGGHEIANISIMGEDTCAPDKENDGGLCYTRCRDGYRGVGPVCWAKSVNIGIGTPVALEPCPPGWENWGLTCRNPIVCDPIDTHGSPWPWKWTGGGCRGGETVGRLDHGGICPGPGGGSDHIDNIATLCYRKCPAELPNHIPGMPYLCYKGGELAYGRGVGTIPRLLRLFGKYTFL